MNKDFDSLGASLTRVADIDPANASEMDAVNLLEFVGRCNRTAGIAETMLKQITRGKGAGIKTYLPDQVADMLGKSTAWVLDEVQRGSMPGYKLGREYRIPASGLDSYLAERKVS